MILFDENGKSVRFNTNENNLVGKGVFGTIYRTDASSCIKVYNGRPSVDIDLELLKTIRGLSLKKFYEIYDLLYTKNGTFKGYSMKYYDNFDIDILTTPTEYTLDNLYNLRDSILKLANNNIYAIDMHDENVILGESDMTVIDVDLFIFTTFYNGTGLMVKNINAVNNLFYSLYVKAINRFHEEYAKYDVSKVIRELFSTISERDTYDMVKKLTKYKYPIDYIEKYSK